MRARVLSNRCMGDLEFCPHSASLYVHSFISDAKTTHSIGLDPSSGNALLPGHCPEAAVGHVYCAARALPVWG